jgi:hypothetical protein
MAWEECNKAGKHGVTAWPSQCNPEEQSAGIATTAKEGNSNPPLNPATRDRLSRLAVNSGKCKWVLIQARTDEQG